ncbi:MAG: hypothetical protein H7Y22_11545 [Gemmatimonadaceae bacterium]|nr:hypothetical protein [Gloeobacterales cyanobacterium ES-bin-141]
MLSKAGELHVTVTPRHFQEDWRLVGQYSRRTNELKDLTLLPPNASCPADARESYCLLLFCGGIQESLRLRGVESLNEPIVWIFDRSGKELEMRWLSGMAFRSA